MAKVCPINCFVSCTINHSYWSYVHQVSYLGGPHCKRWQFSWTISMPIFIPSMKSTNSQGAQALDWLGLTPELLRESDYQVLHSNKNKHQQVASSKLTIDVEWCGFSPHHLNHNCHFPFPAKPRFPHGLFHLSMVFPPDRRMAPDSPASRPCAPGNRSAASPTRHPPAWTGRESCGAPGPEMGNLYKQRMGKSPFISIHG